MNKQSHAGQDEAHIVFGEETAFWNANRHDLSVKYPGKWLLIQGSEVVNALDTFSEAARALRNLDAIALIQPVEPGMARDAVFLLDFPT